MALAPELEKQPSPGLNKPTSGTYGERADLDRLNQQLPTAGAGMAPPAGGAPGMSPMPPPSAPAPTPGGVPAPLLAPTDRPGTPLGTPLVSTGQAPMGPAEAGPSSAQIQFLNAIIADPSVSEVTRRWAEAVLEQYGG